VHSPNCSRATGLPNTAFRHRPPKGQNPHRNKEDKVADPPRRRWARNGIVPKSPANVYGRERPTRPTRNKVGNQQQCRAAGIAPGGRSDTTGGRSSSPCSKQLPDEPLARACGLGGGSGSDRDPGIYRVGIVTCDRDLDKTASET
jgi:hypothetical protein